MQSRFSRRRLPSIVSRMPAGVTLSAPADPVHVIDVVAELGDDHRVVELRDFLADQYLGMTGAIARRGVEHPRAELVAKA